MRLAVALNGYGLERPDGSREILRWEELRGLADTSERLGYSDVFAPEIAGWEAFVSLAGIAAATQRIGLATGVVPLSVREPHRLAMAAASMQAISGGRFLLGVGSREPIEDTTAALRELRRLVDLGEGTDWASAPRHVPILLAALGPRMTALAGELADGVILNWCTPERVAAAREVIGKREGFTIAVYVRAQLGEPDPSTTEALRVAASRYAGMPPYRRQFEAMGVDLSDPEAVVAATCAVGEGGKARLIEYGEAGADVVVVYPIASGDAAASMVATLEIAAHSSPASR